MSAMATAVKALEIVDDLLRQSGFQEDSSTRHNLAIAASFVKEAAESNTPELLAVRANQISAMTKWLDENQPDVWRRGLWDALNAVTTPAATSGVKS